MNEDINQFETKSVKPKVPRGPRAKNGAGCMKKDKKTGRYRFQKQFGHNPDGRPRLLVVTGKTEKECRKKMEAKMEIAKAPPLNANLCKKMTLTDLCYRHFKAHLAEEDRLKPKSADRRESTIRNQVEKYPIGNLQVSSITSFDVDSHIEDLIKAKKLSVSSIQKAYDVINSAYKWAISQQLLRYNPCTAVHDKITHRFTNIEAKRSTVEEIRVLSSEEIVVFKNEANKLCRNGKPKYRIGLAAQLLLATGLRVGELCALLWSDWDRDAHTLSITKTRFTAKDRNAAAGETVYKAMEGIVKNCHWREISLSPEAEELLTKIFAISGKTSPEDYIVLNRSFNPTCPTRFINALNLLFRNSGLSEDIVIHEDISGAHIFRRTCATLMADAGIPTLKIAAYLGDLESTIIKHYIATSKKIKVGNKTKNIVPYPTA